MVYKLPLIFGMSFFESMYIYERVLDVGKDGASYVIFYPIQMY